MASVLLIDDDRELCAMLSDYLSRHGFQVMAEHHGETGLQRAQSGRFAIVLLDVMLPGKDGFRSAAAAAGYLTGERAAADGAGRRCGPHCGTGDRR